MLHLEDRDLRFEMLLNDVVLHVGGENWGLGSDSCKF